MSRFVLDSNNLWLLALSDRTMRVNNGPYSPDLNTQDLSGYVGDWKQVARIGSNQHCTHRELEVFGVALSGQKLVELCLNTFNHQITINREGFMVRWLNPGGGRRVPNAVSLYRRLNDIFDWSRYGVQVPIPVETEWDQFELATGKLITAGGGALMNKELEEKEKVLEMCMNSFESYRVSSGKTTTLVVSLGDYIHIFWRNSERN
ncbi:unnamed protein product [Linum tenue]|uniref:Uncharacterized protein n=2 Tax=Linum tenue TaxID=586396 RepID=A0AAV0RR16_9ROSI|nr:unnamed protein product [Linum tenue]